MKFILSIFTVFACFSLTAQRTISTILSSVEENNTTLKALRETAEAQKLENKSGIYLSNPEVEFGYLWGSPSEIGERTDLSVSQNFDIPTLTGMKGKIAKEQNRLVDWQYKADRMTILLEAHLLCLDLIYYNALKTELELRLEYAETIAKAYQGRLSKGDVTKLEYNKVLLSLSSVQGEASRVEVEQKSILSRLRSLNGGREISLEEKQYAEVQLPLDFEGWYLEAQQKSPDLAYLKQEVELSKKKVSLSKAMGLPTFSAGYTSERVVGERYQGITVGVSIPLWENKNRVKQAKRAAVAAESREADSKLRFYTNLQIQYNRTMGLQGTARTYKKTLEAANNAGLLKSALDAGEISLLDYIVEMGMYYDAVNQALEAERDYQKAFAELMAVELLSSGEL